MTDSKKSSSSEQTLDYLLTKRGEVYSFEMFCDIYARPLTEEEFRYLLRCYPFLEICLPQAEINAAIPAEKIVTETGWLIYDRGDYMACGPGRLSFGRFTDEEDEQGGEGGGHGTLVNQGVLTIQEMMLLALSRWQSIQILRGTYYLKRMAWMLAVENEIAIAGFNPTQKDELRRQYLARVRQYDIRQLVEYKPQFKV